MSGRVVSGTRRTMRELVDGTIRVSVDIDPIYRKDFLELFSEVDMAVALAPLKPVAQPDTGSSSSRDMEAAAAAAGPNELARQMHVDGYFRNSKLWLAMHAKGLYTLKAHKAWIEQQPCCWPVIVRRVANTDYPVNQPTPCQGEVCAHYTDAAEVRAAGGRIQPDAPQKPLHFYTVPLCHQHHMGWAHSREATRGDKRALLEYAVELTSMQVKAAMKRWLKIESLRQITPELLARFHTEVGL